MKRRVGGRRGALAALLVTAGLVAGCTGQVPTTVAPATPVQEAPRPETLGPDPAGGTAGRATDAPTVAPQLPREDAFAPVQDSELLALGDRLTEALAGGDVQAWLDLHELPDEAAVQQQRDWFAGVQAVPMEVREMHPTSVVVTDAPGEHPGPIVEFGFRHQVSGADPVPSVEYYRLTIGRDRASGETEIVTVSGSNSSTRAAYPQLWDLAPVTVLEGDSVVLLVDADEESLALDLLPSLDLAAEQVLSDFPTPGVERMAVTLAEEAVVATLFGDSEQGEYAGFAVPTPASPEVLGAGLVELETAPEQTTVRVVLDQQHTLAEWEYHGDLAGGAPLLRHEGAHLAMMLHDPLGWPPAWAVEGLAGWYEVEADELTREDQLWWYDAVLEDMGVPERIPPSAHPDFFSTDVDLTDRHYADSAMLFWYVEEAYGRDAALALGADLHTIEHSQREGQAVEAAVREHLGVGAEQLELDWLAWADDLGAD